MARELILPAWAEAGEQGVVIIAAEKMYPALLAELGVEAGDVDQYWLKTARFCAMRDVQHAVAGTDHMPPPGGALRIRIKDASKAENGGVSQWKLSEHPELRLEVHQRKHRERLEAEAGANKDASDFDAEATAAEIEKAVEQHRPVQSKAAMQEQYNRIRRGLV